MTDSILTNIVAELRGFNAVLEARIVFQQDGTGYNLRLTLSKDITVGSEAIDIIFHDIGQLFLQSFGGGLSQFMLLDIQDCASDGLERIKLKIHELEHDSIRFTASSVRIIGRRFI